MSGGCCWQEILFSARIPDDQGKTWAGGRESIEVWDDRYPLTVGSELRIGACRSTGLEGVCGWVRDMRPPATLSLNTNTLMYPIQPYRNTYVYVIHLIPVRCCSWCTLPEMCNADLDIILCMASCMCNGYILMARTLLWKRHENTCNLKRSSKVWTTKASRLRNRGGGVIQNVFPSLTRDPFSWLNRWVLTSREKVIVVVLVYKLKLSESGPSAGVNASVKHASDVSHHLERLHRAACVTCSYHIVCELWRNVCTQDMQDPNNTHIHTRALRSNLQSLKRCES